MKNYQIWYWIQKCWVHNFILVLCVVLVSCSDDKVEHQNKGNSDTSEMDDTSLGFESGEEDDESDSDAITDSDVSTIADTNTVAQQDSDTQVEPETDSEAETDSDVYPDSETAHDSSQIGGYGDSNNDGIVNILPMGDSITATGCWRSILYSRLIEQNYEAIDFVGSQIDTGGCYPIVDYDRNHEGYSGSNVSDMTSEMLSAWFDQYFPEVVLLHLGTNDIWGGRTVESMISGFDTVLEGLRAVNPRVVLLVAQIIPVVPSDCNECGALTVSLNEAIGEWANSRHTMQSPVVAVDHWTGWVPDEDTLDGVHPYTETGKDKMASTWEEALIPWLL